MRKVELIQQQIRELNADEFSELRDWILAQDWESWDAQLEADANSGKLDKFISEARADHVAGRTDELPARDVQALWLDEAEHRARQIDNGEVELVSAEELERRVQAILK